MMERIESQRRALGACLALSVIASGGCISLAPRPESISPGARAIDGVPSRRWADNRCAAGALSEVLNSLGDPVTEEQLSESLMPARKGGVVTVDLLIAARTRGFDARLIRGDLVRVQRELEQQHPLILMMRVMDAPGTEDDLFHYVVLTGLDAERRLVQMHYGDGRKRWVSLPGIEPAWAAGGHATFLIGARRRQAATENDLRRAVLLEEEGKFADAIPLYRYFLESHPQSALAWTNLGNAQARLGETQSAEASYRNAVFLESENRDALNNLAWQLLNRGRLEEAEALARRAASGNGTDDHVVLDTLARVLVARGRCQEAQATFDRAVQASGGEEKLSLERARDSAKQECH